MAVTADSVVVELLAKTDGYTSKINGAANDTDAAMSKIERSATRAEGQIVKSAGAIANAQRNIARQYADIGAQVAGGQSPFLILAQQAPQVADALADTGGKAAQVASFFAGPWGAALLAAGSVLGVLVGKSLEAGDSLDDLVEKLQKGAEKTRLTADAQRIFEASATGAAQAVDKLNESLNKENTTQERSISLTLAKARAYRETAIQAQNARERSLELAVALAKEARGATILNGGPGAAGIAQIPYLKNEAAAEKALADAKKDRANAERAVTNAAIPLLDLQAAGASDKATAATQRHERALQKLRDAYIGASQAATTNAQREAATRQYREGRTRIDSGLASELDALRKSGRKGPSAETLARRAEAERVRDVRNNEAYNVELEQLNQSILQARRAQEVDAGQLAEYARQEVESALNKRLAQIDADESAKKYSQEQAANLRKLARENAEIQNLNISADEIRRRTDEQNAIAQTRLSVEGSLLQAQIGITESNEERQRLERRLLDIKYQQLKIEQDAVLRDTTGRYTDAQRQQAQITRDALPSLQRADQERLEQGNRGPYEFFRRNIDNADALADSIDGIKISTLNAVTDELTNATTAALGLSGAFGDIVGQLIQIGIQRQLIGPLADGLFGKADGSTSGAIGGLLGGLFGRASGGYVGPGQAVRVNEGAGRGPELLRMGANGGTVIPLGQAAAAQSGGGTTVLQTISVDARGAVMNDQFASQILARAGQDARQVVNANNGAIRRSLPAAQARLSQLGTTG